MPADFGSLPLLFEMILQTGFDEEAIIKTCFYQSQRMKKILILGYGNTDRQDDGVAWFVLNEIKQMLSPEIILNPGDIVSLGTDHPDLFFYPQLTPEIADIAANYDAMCFVDAHTGSFPEDIRILDIEPLYQTSAFTHHMTPGTILALVEMMHHKKMTGLLVSVKGFEFKFDSTLSSNTRELVKPAVRQILDWVEKIKRNDGNPVTD